MKGTNKHNILRIIALSLAIAILMPVAVKFAHAFTHHNHKVCLDNTTTHFHEFDVDCNFYKFKLNNPHLFPSNYNELLQASLDFEINSETYKFLNNHRPLSFSLRGPPVLV